MTTGPRALRVATLAVTFALVLCFSAVAHADTFNVNDSSDADNVNNCLGHTGGCTLRGAIHASNQDDADSTITLPPADNPPGRYDRDTVTPNGEFLVENDGTLTINGTTGDPTDVLISADGSDRVFEVADGGNLTLNDVTVQDGFASDCGGGGGIRADADSTLTLNNSRVNRNVFFCDGAGGGIAGDDGSVIRIRNGSHVDNNNSVGGGGGIYFAGQLEVTDSTVNGNTASHSFFSGGGGILGDGTALEVNRSSVSNNSDDGPTGCPSYICYLYQLSGGGGILNTGGNDVTLTDSHIDNNWEQNFGGGVATNGSVTMTRSTASNNHANLGPGGGIFASQLLCGQCEELNAQAIDPNSSTLTLTDSTLNGNFSQYSGGGVYFAQNGGFASVSGSTLNGNRAADGGGGAIEVDRNYEVVGVGHPPGDTTIARSTLSNNFANEGGAVANYAGGLLVQNATMDSNTAGSYDGGAVYNDPYTGEGITVNPLEVLDSSLTSNFAYDDGGGIANYRADVNVLRSNIDKNEAYSDYGGGIYNGNSGSLSMQDGTVNNNKASGNDEGRGGGIYTDGKLEISRMNVNGNLAKGYVNCNYECYLTGGNGGGIYSNGTSTSITDSSVGRNIADGWGGGLYNDARGDSTLYNSTFGDNQADALDQKFNNPGNGGGIYTSGPLEALNLTISGNLAATGDGGGIYNDSGDDNVGLKNTIIANNTANGNDPNNCGGGTFVSRGHNIDGKDECNLDTTGANADQVNTDPRLGPLQDNGGNTLTFALRDASAAIDNGDDGTCHDPIGDHDQRQDPRPAGPHCDVGAYEKQLPTSGPNTTTSPTTTTPTNTVPLVTGGPAPTTKCTDTRKFKFKFHHAPKATIVKLTVYVNGKKKLTQRGKHIGTFALSKLPQGNFKVKLVALQSTGSSITSVRRYNGCTKSRPTTKGHHANPHH